VRTADRFNDPTPAPRICVNFSSGSHVGVHPNMIWERLRNRESKGQKMTLDKEHFCAIYCSTEGRT